MEQQAVSDQQIPPTPASNTAAARRFDRVVSLRITDDTPFAKRAMMFADGKDGFYMQEWELYADGRVTDVTMLIVGRSGKKDVEKTYRHKGQNYGDVRTAFEEARHEWARSD